MENELKDNEYIRTDTGKIDKVINANYYMPQYIECEKDLIFKNNIVKHSPNLIDLIECGDYVNGKEVIMDLQKSKEWYKSKDDFITCKDYTFEEKEIKEVVTKEQFESISYKVTKM